MPAITTKCQMNSKMLAIYLTNEYLRFYGQIHKCLLKKLKNWKIDEKSKN